MSSTPDGLDPADPKPLRGDPRWAAAAAQCAPTDASEDELKKLAYVLFRKADKAWSDRKRQRKIKAAAAAQHPDRHPRPRGPTPWDDVCNVWCTWDEQRGVWVDGMACVHDVEAAAARRRSARDKMAWEFIKAERAAQRALLRRECERIDVLARHLMHEAGLSFQLSADCEGDAFEADIDEVSDLDGWNALFEQHSRGYRPDWRPLTALGYATTRGGGLLRIVWSSAYWTLVDALIAAHGGITLGHFYTHLPDAISAHMQPTLREMATAGAAWHAAITAKPKFQRQPLWCGHCASSVEADMSTRFWKLWNPYGASRDMIVSQPFELCLSCAMKGLSTNRADTLAQKAARGVEADDDE